MKKSEFKKTQKKLKKALPSRKGSMTGTFLKPKKPKPKVMVRKKKKKTSRDEELEHLRVKIIEAIRFSKKYWMIYKENTFGIATVLDLIYKRSYIEVLFFTNNAVLEFGVPILKIYTPIETEFDFNDVLLEPDFDEDGLVSPTKIIEKLNDTIVKEVRHHITVLDKEVRIIEENFESYPIDDNPYFRRIRIHFQDFSLKLDIYFETYPLVPKLSFTRSLRRIIKERDFIETDVIKNWDEDYPPHIIEIIDALIDVVCERLKMDRLKGYSQLMLLENVSIKDNIKYISFNIHRGQSIGMIYEDYHPNAKDSSSNPMELFDIIAGKQSNFTGKINMFGTNIQLLRQSEMDKIFILTPQSDSDLKNMSVKKAITHKIKIELAQKKKKNILDALLKEAGLLQKLDEISGKAFEVIGRGPLQRMKRKKDYIDGILDATGLLNKKKKKILDLSALDRIIFSISRALLQSASIIMVSIPFDLFGRLHIEIFNDFVRKIKNLFHVIFIVHGPKEIVSQCDQIITIVDQIAQFGSLDEFIERIPQSGELITIELNNPNKEALREVLSLKSGIFIEERKNERYKIFSKENPDKLILQMIELLGPSLYNFKRFKASIGEYLEFLEFLKKRV